MATIGALLRAYIISLGDPKEPLKLFLGDLWDKLLVDKDQREILVDSLYQALQEESGSARIAWTREELAQLLTLDAGQINFDTLDSGELARVLERAFSNAALIPERSIDKYDFQQIAANVTRRAIAGFESKIQQPEHQELKANLLRDYARRTGHRVSQIEADLTTLSDRFARVETAVDRWETQMDEIDARLKQVTEMITFLRQPGSQARIATELSQEDVASLLIQLENYQDALRVLKENISEYAEPEKVPPQLRVNARRICKKIDGIRGELGLSK